MEIAHLVSIFEAETENFERGADRVEGGFRRIASESEKSGSAAGGFFSKFGLNLQATGASVVQFGQQMSSYISEPIQALGKLGIGFNAAKEQALISFKTMLKSGEEAKKLFSDLMQFANTTPFESPEVINSAKMLKAYGFEVKELMPLLTDAGNLASGMGARFEDVARVFGRLKSGDFGEAFERLRDFGISRQQLEGEGLQFDKSGQYKGSVEQAMTVVRGIIQKNFGGMMEEQSKTFTGRISTLTDAVNLFLGDVTEPLFQMISEATPAVIDFVNYLTEGFKSLSPIGKVAVTAIGAIAAAVGPVIGIVGTLVIGIGAAISAISTIAAAVGSIGLAPLIAIIAGVVTELALMAAGVYAVYQAWDANFGGLKDLTSEIASGIQTVWSEVVGYFTSGEGASIVPAVISGFNQLKEFLTPALSEISGAMQTGFGEGIAWVKENYPLIKETVLTIINAIKIYIGAELAIIAAFWKSHGEEIKKLVSGAWNIIKTYIGGAMKEIGNIIKLIGQVITGDWRGAWNTIKDIAFTYAETVTSLIRQFLNNYAEYWNYVMRTVAQYLKDHWKEILTYIAETVAKIGEFILKLPVYALMAIPAMLKAGMEIGKALWDGMKAGWKGESPAITTPAPNLLGNNQPHPLSGLSSGLNTALEGMTKTQDEAGKTTSAIDKIGDSAKKTKEHLKELSNISFSSLLDAMRIGTGRQENASGKLGLQNSRTGATGLFQVLPSNIPEWTRNTEGVGEMTVEQFKKDARAQVLVFNKYMGEYLRKALIKSEGDWKTAVRMAAAAWYGGEDDMMNFAKNFGGKGKEPTFNQYTSKVLQNTIAALQGKIKAPEFDYGSISNKANAAADLINDLTGGLAGYSDKTELAKVKTKLLGSEFNDMTEDERLRVESLAQLKDWMNDVADGTQKLQQVSETLVPPSEFERILKQIADPNIAAAFENQAIQIGLAGDAIENYTRAGLNYLRMLAIQRQESKAPGFWDNYKREPLTPEEMAGSKGLSTNVFSPADLELPPPPMKPWQDFFKTLRSGFESIRKSLPSMKQQLGELLLDLPYRAGDAWARALNQTDGTIKGFFKSIGMAFANLAKQLLMEVTRLLVIKMITKLIGAALGGIGGGGTISSPSGLNQVGGMDLINLPGYAKGGIIPADQMSIVGEKGWELAVPQAPTTILNQNQIAGALFGNNQRQQPIVINNNFYANPRTGVFDKESAQQAAKRTTRYQETVIKRNR